MQRWEYCRVEHDRIEFMETSGMRLERIPQKTVWVSDLARESDAGSREAAIATLGLQGWEAYAVDEDHSCHHMKRPIPDSKR